MVPWAELLALIEPLYPKSEMGRKLVGPDIMLLVYFLQQWFALSDPGVEDTLYESQALRRFAGVDLGRAPAPGETTILNFRHLLEAHELCGQMLDAVNLYLVGKVILEVAPHAQDMTSRQVKTKAGVEEAEKPRNRTKARVGAKVEWPLRIFKRVFRLT